jgi:hypothetical protein
MLLEDVLDIPHRLFPFTAEIGFLGRILSRNGASVVIGVDRSTYWGESIVEASMVQSGSQIFVDQLSAKSLEHWSRYKRDPIDELRDMFCAECYLHVDRSFPFEIKSILGGAVCSGNVSLNRPWRRPQLPAGTMGYVQRWRLK